MVHDFCESRIESGNFNVQKEKEEKKQTLGAKVAEIFIVLHGTNSVA